MKLSQEKIFINTGICKAYFWLLAAFFALLCTKRTELLFPGSKWAFFIALAVLALAALLWRRLGKQSEEKRIWGLALVFALACVYGMSLHMPKQDKSLIWLLLYILCAFFLSHALKRPSSKAVRLSAAGLGCLFALIVLIGGQLKAYDRLELLYNIDLVDIFRALLCTAGEALLFTVLLNMLFACSMEKEGDDNRADGKFSLGRMLIYTVLILLCWLPYFYAFYPGNLSPDSMSEMKQCVAHAGRSNQQPFIHQLFIGLCLSMGGENLELGVGIYSAMQMLLMALSFAVCICFLEYKGIRKGPCRAALVFFALFPVNSFYSITMWKDVLHGGICLVFMILLVQESFGKKRSSGAAVGMSILMALTAFLFCLFRNNGWYAFLLGFPVYIVCNRKSWKRLSAVFLATIALVSAYNWLIYDVLGVSHSPSGEMLSVPLQQIARVAENHPEELESQDFAVLEEVFYDIETLGDRYASYISDPVKARDSFKPEVFDADPGRYVRSWVQLGLRHPLTYIEAFLLQNYGYWYPDVEYWIVHNSLDDTGFGLSQREETKGLRFEMSMIVRDLSISSPLSIIFSLALVVWLLLIAAVMLLLKGRGAVASPLALMAMFWLTTLASPVYCEYRYLYGLVLCVPLYLGLAFGLKRE